MGKAGWIGVLALSLAAGGCDKKLSDSLLKEQIVKIPEATVDCGGRNIQVAHKGDKFACDVKTPMGDGKLAFTMKDEYGGAERDAPPPPPPEPPAAPSEPPAAPPEPPAADDHAEPAGDHPPEPAHE